MGYVYSKRGKLYVGYTGQDGKPKQRATAFEVGQEKQAKELLRQVEARVALGLIDDTPGPLTVKKYTKRWLDQRTARGLTSTRSDSSYLQNYALPRLGDMPMDEVRPRHIQELVRDLTTKGKKLKGDGNLAPRSIRHVYAALHMLFEEAVAEEVISVNPCKMKRGQLPKLRDKDPKWRSSAVFTRDELETLVADPRIAEDQRVLYSVMLLAGLRFGETAALRWNAYDPTAEQLGRLDIVCSYDLESEQEKLVKTERPRAVPVHRVLERILSEWHRTGWKRYVGRAPKDDDLIIPWMHNGELGYRHRKYSIMALHADLERLGLRKRRQHDMRRTLISLARADGARTDVLETITHGPRGDIINQYTTFPWTILCDEMAKLQVTFGTDGAGTTKKKPSKSKADFSALEAELTANLPQILSGWIQSGKVVGELGFENFQA